MEHAAARGHATGRDDDRRRVDVIDLFRLLRAAHHMHGLNREGISSELLRAQLQILTVTAVNIGNVDGHRAIHIDRQRRDSLRAFQAPNVIDEQLRAVHGECRNDNDSPAMSDSVDDLRQRCIWRRLRGMIAVAVCRFAKHEIRARRPLGIFQQRLLITAQISRKENCRVLASLRNHQLQARRTQNVSCVMRANEKLRADAAFARPRHGR